MQNNDMKFKVAVGIIVVLLLIVGYFVITPQIQGYIVQKQVEAKDITLMYLINQIQQTGYAQISVGNQTLYLAPVQPQQSQPTQ